MKKMPVLIFCFCMIFSSDCFAESLAQKCLEKPVTTRKKKAPSIFRPFINLFNKITGKREPMTRPFLNVKCLELSRIEVYAESAEDSQTIEVKATPDSDPPDLVTVNYTVTGGKIVGEGRNVIWDLSGVKPGTYFIVAGADNGCGVCGATITMEAKVKEKK